MYSRTLAEKLKPRPRRDLSETQPIVGEEWKEEEPALPSQTVAPRMIGATRVVLWWLLAASVVFFLGAVGFFTYYFTLGGGANPASPNNIDIAISGPTEVAGGEPAQLQIVVTNRNRVTLELADLVITYPQGTRSPTDFATDLPSQRISLGTIEPGGRRQGTISAVFSGSEGAQAAVKAELEYRISGSNSIFVAASDYELAFSSSPLSISIDGNVETTSGQPIELTVTVAADASAPVKDVLLSIDYPFGFKFASASPAPANNEQNLWALGDLSPGERRPVTIRGTLSGEQGDNRVFHFSAGTRKSSSNLAIDTKFASNTYGMRISQPFLGLTIAVNKESGTGVVISPGENVIVTINYQNNLSTQISDAVIAARLSGVLLDGSNVNTTDGFFRSSDDTVLWDKTTTQGKLASLPPGERGSVSFTFQMPTSDALKGIVNPRLDINVNAAGRRLSEAGVPQNLQSTVRQNVKIGTDLAVAAQGLYYANPFGSSGPMPPQAGKETTYGVVFTITNTTNKVLNATMTAKLPPYVRWVGVYRPSTERLTFNQLDGTVTWLVGTIEPGAGLNGVEPRQAAIAIGLTPSTSQIGQSPPLITNIVLKGKDAATGADISREAANVTTNILGDPGFAPANATVVR